MQITDKTEKPRLAGPIAAGVMYAVMAMAAGAVITAAVFMLTDRREESLIPWMAVIHGAAAAAGGFAAGRKAGAKGWYAGGSAGAGYGIFLAAASSLGFDQSVGLTSFLYIIGTFVTGALGGIMGVNTKK